MADTLAPKLSGGVTFEQPVPQPSVLSGVAGLTSMFLSGNTTKATKPTAAEAKSSALLPYAKKLDDIMSSSLTDTDKQRAAQKVLRQGFVNIPEYGADLRNMRENYGLTEPVQQVLPEDAETTAMNEWVATPRGQLALNRAFASNVRGDGSVDEKAVEAEVHSAMLEDMRLTDELERLKREEETEKVVSEKYWDEFKPTARGTVDAILPEIHDIYNDIRMNGSFVITEEMSELTGMPSGTVDQTNTFMYLSRYRSQVVSQLRGELLARTGKNSNELDPASEQWINDVMAPLDAVIEVAKSDFGSMESVFKTMQTVDSAAAWRSLKPELRRQISVVNQFPDEYRVQVSTSLWSQEGIAKEVSEAILMGLAADRPLDEIAKDAVTSSADDAATKARVSQEALRTGTVEGQKFQNTFMTFFNNRDRTAGSDTMYLSDKAFDTIITKNSRQLGQELSHGDFYAKAGTVILSDLNMTFTAAVNEAASTPNTELFINELGELDVNVKPVEGTSLTEGQINGIKQRVLTQPKAILLNKKLATLKTIKGTEGIFTAFGNMNPATFSDDIVEGSQGNDTILADEGSLPPFPSHIRDDRDFLQAVSSTSSRLGVDPSDLMRVMYFETGGSFDPAQKNMGGSSGTGLIQFMAATAKELGTTTERLAGMSRSEQMYYVEKYLTPKLQGVDNPTFSDLYMAVLWPKAVGKDDNYVLWNKGTAQYKANSGLDMDGNGTITKGEAAARAWGRSSGAGPMPSMTGEVFTSIRDAVRPPSDTPEFRTIRTEPEGGATGAVEGTQVPSQPEAVAGSQTTTSQEGTESIRVASEAEIAKLSDQTKEMLARLEVDTDSMPSFKTREEMMKAFEQGLVKDGDVVLVEGHIEMV